MTEWLWELSDKVDKAIMSLKVSRLKDALVKLAPTGFKVFPYSESNEVMLLVIVAGIMRTSRKFLESQLKTVALIDNPKPYPFIAFLYSDRYKLGSKVRVGFVHPGRSLEELSLFNWGCKLRERPLQLYVTAVMVEKWREYLRELRQGKEGAPPTLTFSRELVALELLWR